VANVRVQIDYRAFPEAVIAARYHHRLVSIQPFPNGNGRHARFMADLLLKELTGKIFTWGQNSLGSGGEARTAYLKALQAADGGDYGPLLFFLGITSGSTSVGCARSNGAVTSPPMHANPRCSVRASNLVFQPPNPGIH
jgi:hypothetical protein